MRAFALPVQRSSLAAAGGQRIAPHFPQARQRAVCSGEVGTGPGQGDDWAGVAGAAFAFMGFPRFVGLIVFAAPSPAYVGPASRKLILKWRLWTRFGRIERQLAGVS
jgi:hypothetical protein